MLHTVCNIPYVRQFNQHVAYSSTDTIFPGGTISQKVVAISQTFVAISQTLVTIRQTVVATGINQDINRYY